MMSRTATALACLTALGTLVACTSDGPTDPSTPAPDPSSAATVGPTSRTSTQPTSPARGLEAVDGTLLVAGPSRGNSDVYRITNGRVERVTTGAHATTLGRGSRTVVGIRGAGDADALRELRGTRLVTVAGRGFDPDVSPRGTLATVRVGSGTSTPGISKPSGFELLVRPASATEDLVRLRTTQSMGSPTWVGDYTLYVAVADGSGARVVRVEATSGKHKDIGVVRGGDDLELTASTRAITVATDDGAVLLTFDGQQRSFPRGWTPLCWPEAGTVLATRSGRLAGIAVGTDGGAGKPAVLGTLPAGTSAFAAACGPS